MSTALELCGVSYEYNPKTPFATAALKDIDLSFEKGRITGIIGHTGSGKSTLVQMLNGLLRPTAGRVLLDGADIWEKPKKITSVRFRVGLVMQYPEYQLFIHSYVDGHLGCFHIWVIVNNPACINKH